MRFVSSRASFWTTYLIPNNKELDDGYDDEENDDDDSGGDGDEANNDVD